MIFCVLFSIWLSSQFSPFHLISSRIAYLDVINIHIFGEIFQPSLVYVRKFLIAYVILCNINTLNQFLFGDSFASDRFHQKRTTSTANGFSEWNGCANTLSINVFSALFFFRRIQKLATFWLNIRFRRIYEFDKCWSVFFAGFSLFGFVYSTKNAVLFSAALWRTGGVQRNNITKTDRLWHLHTVMHKLNTKNWMGYFGSMDSNKYISCTLFHFMTTLYVYVIDGIYDLNWHDANE